MTEPTPQMHMQMKGYLQRLQSEQGWTKSQCHELAIDYKAAIQTPEGFSAIQAHLSSMEHHTRRAA